MKKQAVVGLVVAAVVAVGGGVYVITKNKEEKGATSTSGSTANTQEISHTEAFAPKVTANTSFEAKLSGSTAEGNAYVGTIAVDTKGNSKYSGEQDGKTFAMYTIDGSYIMCSDNTCYKLPSAQNGAQPVSSDQYEYNEDDYRRFSTSAVHKGSVSCSSGTCEEWEITDNGQRITMLLDNQKRVNTVSGTSSNGTTYKIEYTYKDVTITAPTNVQTIPTP